jgi:hypothetical protein
MKRGQGDKEWAHDAWRVQHDKYGKFQYLFLVLAILQIEFVLSTSGQSAVPKFVVNIPSTYTFLNLGYWTRNLQVGKLLTKISKY